MLFVAKSTNIEVIKKTEKGEQSFPVVTGQMNPNDATEQFVCRFYSGELVTEKVVREGAGYATTQREKDVADEKQQKCEEQITKFLVKTISQVEKAHKPQPKPKEDNSIETKPSAPSGLFSEISSFNRNALKPTQTVEQKVPVVGSGNKYGHSSEAEIKEHFDDEETLNWKVKQLADLIRNAKHCVVFTGAGISTSAKIPDYRGPKGVWTLRDRGETAKMEITLSQALPTVTFL